jgi:hypothetical protein
MKQQQHADDQQACNNIEMKQESCPEVFTFTSFQNTPYGFSV